MTYLPLQAAIKVQNSTKKTPKFSEFSEGTERKDAFKTYFSELIAKENNHILDTRNRINLIRSEYLKTKLISDTNKAWILATCKKYALKTFDFDRTNDWLNLLIKVDIVPKDLILAQAALESGWGTSRFSQEANNYFGQWCFRKGCGVVPAQRKPGHKHEVQSFKSPEASLQSYMRNLNSNVAYVGFRQSRRKMRVKGERIDGHKLAQELHLYATNTQYAKLVQGLIADIKEPKVAL